VKNLIANIISWVFHPLLMVTYLFTIFILFFPVGLEPIRANTQWNFLFLVFSMTFLLPVVNIVLLKFFGTLSRFSMPTRKDRIVPFFFIAVLHTLLIYMFYSRTRISIDDNLLKFLIIADALIVASFVITLFYKISVHAIGVWGLTGILLTLNQITTHGALFYPLVGCIAIAGAVMSARLQLNAHTSREVWMGAVVGLAVSFIGMVILF
jgi:hypothetical protein